MVSKVYRLLKIKLDLFWQPNNKWNPSNISLTYSQENPLTLILEEGKAETSWILRQGSIQVPLSLNAPGDNILQSLWPTGEIKNISALSFNQGGFISKDNYPNLFIPILQHVKMSSYVSHKRKKILTIRLI